MESMPHFYNALLVIVTLNLGPGELGVSGMRWAMSLKICMADILCGCDVTSMPADHIHSVLAQDWTHLMHSKKILNSPNYHCEKGRPAVGLLEHVLYFQLFSTFQ
jgi:hypothetical protein